MSRCAIAIHTCEMCCAIHTHSLTHSHTHTHTPLMQSLCELFLSQIALRDASLGVATLSIIFFHITTYCIIHWAQSHFEQCYCAQRHLAQVYVQCTLKANSYFARSRPHIDDYGKIQINLILILPAKTIVRANINASVHCVQYNANSLAFILAFIASSRLLRAIAMAMRCSSYRNFYNSRFRRQLQF